MEIEGTLIKILPVESGQTKGGGEWMSQTIVIESGGPYPKQVAVNLFGDKINLLNGLIMNDRLSVSVNLESREYNDKWFTKVNAWKIAKL
jgi:hypothetical protein